MNWDIFLWVSVVQHEVCMGSQISSLFRDSSAISYSCKTSIKMWWKARDERALLWCWCFPSIHSVCMFLGPKIAQVDIRLVHVHKTHISGEKQVFSSPLSVLEDVLLVWFWLTIILILCETFKILKLRSCSYKAQNYAVECIKIYISEYYSSLRNVSVLSGKLTILEPGSN